MEERPVLGFGQPKRIDHGSVDEVPAVPPRAPIGTPDDAPVEAIVRVNIACNQHCFFCNTDSRADNIHEKPERVYQYIRENKDALYLSFSGGEPTLNPNILRYIKYASSLKIPRVIIQTNAMMSSYPEFADKLVEAGLTSAFVSLHAPEAKVSDKITATPGSWEVTLKGIRNLLDRGIELEINTVVNGHNYTLLPQHARFVAERFPEIVCISLSYVAPTGFCVVNRKNIPRIRDVQPYLFEAIDILTEAGIPAKMPDRCGIPLCAMRGYEKHHEALMYGPFAGTGVVTSDHMKHEGCTKCVWNDRCIGWWTESVELWGTDDLIPVTEPVDVAPMDNPLPGTSPELVRQFLEEETTRLRARLLKGAAKSAAEADLELGSG